MFFRFFLRRFVFLLLAGGLLFGGARALFGAGYRQGFVQGSLLAAGDGQAVTVAPEAHRPSRPERRPGQAPGHPAPHPK